jgi:ankyrin repeat protein
LKGDGRAAIPFQIYSSFSNSGTSHWITRYRANADLIKRNRSQNESPNVAIPGPQVRKLYDHLFIPIPIYPPYLPNFCQLFVYVCSFYYGQTPLSIVAENRPETVIKLLLAKDGVNQNSKGKALSLAAANGHQAVMTLLLTNDSIDPDSNNTYGQTPLLLIVEKEHEAMIKCCLRRTA